MKLYRIFSFLAILTLIFSYLSLPVNVATAIAPEQTGEQSTGKLATTLFQDAQDPCALLAQGTGTLQEMIAWAASCPQSNLLVKKFADVPDAFVGEPIGFMIAITNLSSTNMIGLEVRDRLDPHTGWSVNHPDCSIDTNSLLTCHLNLPAGWSTNIHISANSTADMCGVLDNVAVATVDGLTAGAHASINIHCLPDIVIDKSPVDPSISAGERAQYSLVVTNIGDGAAENVSLTDSLPAAGGLTWSIESVTGGGDCSITGGVLSCGFGLLEPGETRTVIVTSSETSPSICGDITNEASVAADNENETDLANNRDSATVTVYCTTLELEKLADAEVVKANEEIGFTITVTNTGDYVAREVNVTDSLPAGVEWSEDSSACSITSSTLSCSFGDLAPGNSASVHITGLSSAAVCGVVSNTATATAENLPDPVDDTATVNVTCAPMISVVKRPESNMVPFGSMVRFTMTVTNYGTAPAEDVTLSDPLPPDPDLTWSFDNVTEGGICSIADGVLNCTFGTLPAGGTASVRISAMSSQDTCGYILNTVTADGSNTPPVIDIARVYVACDVNVRVTKTAERDEIVAGEASQPARFTILVENNGPYTATNVILSDPLSTTNSLNWTIDSATTGSNCSITSGTLNCNMGSLAPGEQREIVISSPTSSERFCRPSANRTIENLVTVTASNEPLENTADNTDYATIQVLCNQPFCESPDGLYANNFNNGVAEAANWSFTNVTTSPNGTQTFLGELNNDDLVFTYDDTDVAGHYMIIVSFDLYAIRSWDGNVVNHYGVTVGPDRFQFRLLNESGLVERTLLDTTFNNYFEPEFEVYNFFQSYPRSFSAGLDLPPGTGSSAQDTLGYQFTGPRDSVYHFAYSLPHTERTVKLSMEAFGLQKIHDESWGIDNFRLRLIRCNTLFFQENNYFMPVIAQPSSQVFQTSPLEVIRTEPIETIKNK